MHFLCEIEGLRLHRSSVQLVRCGTFSLVRNEHVGTAFLMDTGRYRSHDTTYLRYLRMVGLGGG